MKQSTAAGWQFLFVVFCFTKPLGNNTPTHARINVAWAQLALMKNVVKTLHKIIMRMDHNCNIGRPRVREKNVFL